MKKINIPQIPSTIKLTVNLGEDPRKGALVAAGLYFAARHGATKGAQAATMGTTRSHYRPFFGRRRRIHGDGPIEVLRTWSAYKLQRKLYKDAGLVDMDSPNERPEGDVHIHHTGHPADQSQEV